MTENVTLIRNRTEVGQGRTWGAGASAQPAWVVIVLASVLIFTSVVDVLGNMLVIVSVLRNRKLRNAGNVFIVSLAFADLLVVCYPYPLALHSMLHAGWLPGETECKVSGFLMGASVIGSVFNIMAIAVNRYCFICQAGAYEKVYGRAGTLVLLALVWALTAVAILPNLALGSLDYDPRIFSCTFSQTVSASYTIAVVTVHFLLPITVVTFCYLRIWALVLRVRKRVSSDVRLRLRPSELRHFLTTFVVFVLFAICWAPLNLIGLAVAMDPPRIAPMVPDWLFVASYFMAYFNSCLNAVVYGLLNQNFRREYRRILLSLCKPHLFLLEISRGGTERSNKQLPGNNNTQQKAATI
ncbi:melatonin receptor type 1B-A [Electrophorus electricus]|uniref:G-protein coupled receptors family 1 profile domain-containing protein n=1 Tax=Electrophorus electricus TaxID=8005 RepID=A0A4W4HAP1_ELEEL|nr:melatonin receptor type 1B-A [Electrophorus electricus]